MLDTGVDINFIKSEIIPRQSLTETRQEHLVMGIGLETGKAQSEVKVSVAGELIKFSIVPDEFAIPCFKILGTEFFISSHEKIDFET